MIYFSQSKQSFYDLNLEYIELPDDLIEINEEQHFDLLHKISSGHYVFSDLTLSEPKPSPGGVSKSMLKQSRLNFDKIEKCE
ncbi:hypothetical protein ACT4Y0_15085 [Acinetobacter baumannii]